MKKKLTIMIISTAMVFLAANSVLAQGPGNSQNRFHMEFEQTQQVLERAKMQIDESRIEVGRELLKIAFELQNRARNHGMNSQFLRGLSFTQNAREKARSAMLLNRQAYENESVVLRQLERTDELIHRVGGHVDQNTPRPFLSLFDSARESQRKAWEFYHNRQLRPALKLSLQAERTIRGLIDKAQDFQNRHQRLRQQYDQLEQMRAMIQDRVAECNNDEARRLMDQVREHFMAGRNYLAEGAANRAENMLNIAHRLLNEVNELCSDYGSLENKMEQLRHELDRLNEQALSGGNDNIRRMLNSAREYLEKAEQHCQNSEYEACAANLRAAQLNVRKARDLMGI